MSTGYSLFSHVLWITLQILVFGYHNLRPVMANTLFTPYVSEFEYTSRFHPSKNPDCGMGWYGNANEFDDEQNQRNSESARYGRSPEEGLPVGQEPSIEVRAILLRCPKTEEETDDILINRNIYNITAGRSQEILDFHGFDRDEPTHHSEVYDCRRKLMITMKFNNIGRTRTREEFVVIDHVLDPVTMHKARLLNPFVIKVRQEPVLQLYGLKFQGIVNAEATEEVINNKEPNYMGCDDSSSNPTCGQMYFDDKPIPYSQGFCCSCDPEVNNLKEASACNESIPTPVPSFFSRARERLVRLDKKARNGKKSFLDSFSYPEEIREPSASNDDDENVFDGWKNSYNHERDLINLKNSKTANKNVEKSLNPLSDEFGNKNRIGTYDTRRVNTSTSKTDLSRMVAKKPAHFEDREPNTKMSHKAAIRKPQENDKGGLSKRRSPINLIDELTKLEEDYKNFRKSSIIKDEEKKDPMSNKKRLNNEAGVTWTVEKFPDQRLTVNNTENFRPLESLEKKLLSKNDVDNHNSIPNSTLREDLRVGELIHDRNLTPIINIIPTFAAKNNHSINNSAMDILPRNNRSLQNLQTPATITASSVSESPVILWQKLSSDRVYPPIRNNHYSSEIRTNVTEDWSRSTTEMTLSSNEKFDRNVADLLADIVFSADTRLSSRKNVQSVDDRPISGNREKAMTSKRSFTPVIKHNARIKPKLESAARMGQRDENDFTRSFDGLPTRAKNSTHSSSSFSSRNHRKNDAIVSSSSLRNQLGNWLTYEEAKQYETRAGGKNLSENNDEKIEFGNKDEIEGKKVNGAVKNHDFREDRSSIISKGRPVQVYLGMRYDREALKSVEDKSIFPQVQSDEQKSAHPLSLDYSQSKDVDIVARKTLQRSHVPRSSRSIAEDNRFYKKDNNQQKIIDRKIEDEFEEITDVLKDAGNGPKVIKEKPRSEHTFEKDDAVVGKYASILDKIPADIGSTIHPTSAIIQTGLSRNSNDNHLQSRKDDNQKSLKRSKLRNIQNSIRIEKFNHIDDNSATMINEKVTNRFKVDNEYSNVPTILEKSTELTRIFPPTTPLLPLTTESSTHSTTIAAKSPIDTRVEIPLDKLRQKAAKAFKHSIEIPKSPGSDKNEAHGGLALLTIEDVKTKLLKHVKLNSPLSLLKNIEVPLSPGNVEEHWTIVNVVREVNTELTPAEKVEDLITEAETLPPDEEINSTTTEVPKEMNLHSFITSYTFSNTVDSNSTVFSRFAIRNLDGQSLKKKANKVLLLIEEALPSAFASGRQREIVRGREKSMHHHFQPNSRNDNNKRLTGTQAYSNQNAVMKGTAENENRENSFNVPIIRKETIVFESDGEKATTRKILNSMPTFSNIQETQTKNNYQEIPVALEDIRKNELKLSNSGRQISNPQQILVSIDDSSKFSDKSVDTVPNTLKNRADSNLIFAKTSRRSPLNSNKEFVAIEISGRTTPAMITGRSRRNLQNFSSRKFQSFYPRSSDIIAMSERENSVENEDTDANNLNNKKEDTVRTNENRREALIFYDYENNEEKGIEKDDKDEESHDDLNIDDKRSLDNLVPGEIIGGLEPSEGWKEKMEMLKLKKHADVLKEYLNWRQDILPLEPEGITGYTTEIMTEENEEETTCITTTSKSTSTDDYREPNLESTSSQIAETNPSRCSSLRNMDPITRLPNAETNQQTLLPTGEPKNKCLPIEELNPTTCSPITETHPPTSPLCTKPIEPTCSPIEETKSKSYPTNTQTIPIPLPSITNSVPTPCDQHKEITSPRSTCQQEEIPKAILETDAPEVTIPKSSCQQNGITEATQIVNKLLPIFITTFRSDNTKNIDALATHDRVDIPTGCFHRESNMTTTHEDVDLEEKKSTGRILPPCDLSEGPCQVDNLQTTPRSSLDVPPDCLPPDLSENKSDRRNLTGKKENSCNIISLLKQSLLADKKLREINEKKEALAKKFKHDRGTKYTTDLHKRRRRSKKKKSEHKVDKRLKARSVRKLMFLAGLDESNDDYEEDQRFEDSEDDEYADFSSDMDTNNYNMEKEHVKLNLKWDNVIDKILHENVSMPRNVKNVSNSWSTEIPSDYRSALKELHIYDTDKYIKNIAKKIVHNNNKYVLKDDKDVASPNKKNSRVKRKLMQYSKNVFSPRLKLANSRDNEEDSTVLQLNSVQKKEAPNATFHAESSGDGKDGRDFAISLSGKIHMDRGTNGQLMSISFDTSPDSGKPNETVQLMANETTKSTNDTKVNTGTAANLNVLSNLFNIDPAPTGFEHISYKETKNSSSLLLQPPRPVRNDDLANLSKNRSDKFSTFIKNAPNVRKRRSTDPQVAKRYLERRHDRFYDMEDIKDSEKSEDTQNYPEDEYDYSSGQNHDSPDANLLESAVHSADTKENDKSNNHEVKLFEIIPLELEQPALSGKGQGLKSRSDGKVSRMTASQLPKNPDENIPGITVKPGKIAPAELPWKEDEYVDEKKSESKEKNIEPHSPYIYSLNSPEENQLKGSNDAAEKLNPGSNSKYELVPLVHIQIHQQPMNKEGDGGRRDENLIVPLGPGGHGSRSNIATIPQGVVDNHMATNDRIPTMNFPNNGNELSDGNCMQDHTVSVDNMNRNKGMEETYQPDVKSDTPCSQSTPSILNDTCYETTQSPAETTNNEDNANNSEVMIEPDLDSNTESRKKIRTKNMLAILEFMEKINQIMRGNQDADYSKDEDNGNAIVKLERVVVFPKNCSGHSFKTPEEFESSTELEVTMGEGITQKAPCKEKNPGKRLEPSAAKAISGVDYSSKDKTSDEAGSQSTALSNVANFLLNGKNAFTNTASKSTDKVNGSQIFPIDNNRKSLTNFRLKSKTDSSTNLSQRNTNNISVPGSVLLPDNIESVINIEPSKKNVSETNVVPWNFERNIDAPSRDMKNRDREDHEVANTEKSGYQERYASVNKKKAKENVLSLTPKVNVHRSVNSLSSDRENSVVGGGEGSVGQSQLSTGVSSRISTNNSGNFRMAKGIPREKRRRRKKKRRRKKNRRRKKKKKRKKGRNPWAVNRGKSWWPFKRQLMSLSEKQHAILGSNFHQRRAERFRNRKRAHPRFPLKQRKVRRLPRAYYPLKKKKINKNYRQYKYVEKKKKNMKRVPRKTRKKTERNKRQINPGGTQTRGGQDCMDRRHPSNVNPVKYLESAHCLRFSDLWYSAYELDNPIMEHTVYLQVFEKHSLPDGTTHWDDRTQGTMVRMGTFTRHQRDEQPTIVFTYSGARTETQNRALNLDPSRQRLLVPSPVAPNKASQYSAVRDPGEYLVVETNLLSKDGTECDKAGVGFVAFAKQEDRCGHPKGSCLKNQPLAYWRHDMKARDSGRPGCYFLSNFATVPTNPIKYNISGTGNQEYLGLEYHSAHVSAIDIEVRTDYNAIVRVGSSGRVTEVYVDSTSLEHTVVTVVMSNMGLASSPYQPRITDCPTGLPVSWTKAKGVMQVIPPQHDQRVTLDLYGQLLLNGFHCTVEIVNHRGELVAMRRIRVQKMDRCFCVWHCLCACIGSVSGIGCQPMSMEHYHAAGFQGPVPVITTETSFLMNTIKDVLMLCSLLVLLLLLLGILKWFIGLFVPMVGRWGLESLLEGTKIEKYLEPELQCRCVVTDENDVPVHPDTGERTVRICSRKLEFFLNLLFFLTYPIVVCCNFCKRSWQSSHQHRCCPDESTMCLINEEQKYPKQICVNTYGDCTNSKLEAEDTRYVINELKKSQESLQNPKGTKTEYAFLFLHSTVLYGVDEEKYFSEYLSNLFQKTDGDDNDKTLLKESSSKKKNTSDVTAKRFVTKLLEHRTVFRNLTEPIGGLFIPLGTIYSLRGYFLNAENGGYRFITPCPFKQYWLIENNEKKSSNPPEMYPSHFFMRSFNSAREVYDSNEISLTPKGICINVRYFNEH